MEHEEIETRLYNIEVKVDVLYSQQNKFEIANEKTMNALESFLKIKYMLYGMIVVIPVFLTLIIGLLAWDINRIINQNDSINSQQDAINIQQNNLINNLQLEQVKSIELIRNEINSLEANMKKRFKDYQ